MDALISRAQDAQERLGEKEGGERRRRKKGDVKGTTPLKEKRTGFVNTE